MDTSFLQKYQQIEVIYPQTLFDPDFSLLQQDRCPICTCKLRLVRNRIWICRSTKHGKPYVITVKRMAELKVNQEKKEAGL